MQSGAVRHWNSPARSSACWKCSRGIPDSWSASKTFPSRRSTVPWPGSIVVSMCISAAFARSWALVRTASLGSRACGGWATSFWRTEMFKWKPGRLFWKLLLALWISMILTITGAATYFHLIGMTPPEDARIARIGVLPVAPLVSAGIAILITGLALAWYLSRPLQHLHWALHRMAEGRLDTRVQPLMGNRSDEIVDLAHDFDRMAAQLQQLTESRR